jgi:hypothetical protein
LKQTNEEENINYNLQQIRNNKIQRINDQTLSFERNEREEKEGRFGRIERGKTKSIDSDILNKTKTILERSGNYNNDTRNLFSSDEDFLDRKETEVHHSKYSPEKINIIYNKPKIENTDHKSYVMGRHDNLNNELRVKENIILELKEGIRNHSRDKANLSKQLHEEKEKNNHLYKELQLFQSRYDGNSDMKRKYEILSRDYEVLNKEYSQLEKIRHEQNRLIASMQKEIDLMRNDIKSSLKTRTILSDTEDSIDNPFLQNKENTKPKNKKKKGTKKPKKNENNGENTKTTSDKKIEKRTKKEPDTTKIHNNKKINNHTATSSKKTEGKK